MDHPNQSSKKRKRVLVPNHPLLGGMFTRSKSQIYIHRNRSGRSRSDSIRTKSHYRVDSHPKTQASDIDDYDDDNDELHILIKHLRTRRVFSLKSIDACHENLTNEKLGLLPFDPQDEKNMDLDLHTSDETNNKAAESFDLEVSCNLLVGDGNGGLGNLEHKGEVDLNEECVLIQTTPLSDDEVFGIKQVHGNGGKSPRDTRVGEAFLPNIDKKTDSISDTKSVLKPCFRRKLFKTPGSFSYKRLLPYLMDITKHDNSCTTEISQCPKLEKGAEEPKLASKSQQVSIDKSNVDNRTMECYTGVSGTSPTSVLISVNESSNGSIPNLTSSEHITESSLMSLDSNNLVDECHSQLSVNGKNEKIEMGFSCEDPENDLDPDSSLVMEDSHSNKDIISGTHSNDATDESDSIVENLKPSIKDNTKQSETGGTKKFNVGDPCKAQNFNPDLSESEKNRNSVNAERRGLDDSGVSNHVDNPNEESVQMTPPDDEIFGKPSAEEHGGGMGGFVLKSTDHGLGKLLNKNSSTNNVGCASNRRNYSDSKSKLVLNSPSRLKLFKSPGSLSYRRLLPFLMDITKENSCASGNGHCPKLDKALEHTLLPSSATSDCQEIPTANANGHRFHAEHHSSDSCALPMAALTTADDSFSNDEPKLNLPQDISESPISLDLQKEHCLKVEQVMPDRSYQLEIPPDNMRPVHKVDPRVTLLCAPVSCESLSREEGAIPAFHGLSVDTEAVCTNLSVKFSNGAKPVEADSLCQKSTKLEASVPLGIHGAGLKKGILKRNPRGCRGLCTCLNCASFRLHAERTFEFSRNQMQDAEEVALDLIKELSYVRNMLEKSADGVNNHSVVHVHQVKEACRKASEAEEQAKHRLGQMNCDLNIHCRITCLEPARVRFATYVEEKVIPKADLQSK